jgi:hypothetical protein
MAMGLLFLAAPGLRAQEASVVSSEIRGDVDGDGQVTAADAAAVRAYLVRGTVPQGRSILPAGDANADGRVTAADAALISRYAAGVDVSRFPVGRRVGEEDGGRVPTIDGSRTLMTFYECTTSLTTGETRCRAPAPGGGASLDVIAGPTYVEVTTTNDSVISHGTTRDTVIMTVTLHNKMSQPMGTEDGSRMFFQKTLKAATATSGNTPPVASLTVIPVDALGPVNFVSEATGSNWTGVKYYQFDGVVQPADSISKEIRIAYDPRVLTFNWVVLVATDVPVKQGTVVITAPADSVIALDSTAVLLATPYYFSGAVDTATITWGTTNAAVASVDPSTGAVTGESEGTAIITATASSLLGILRADSQTVVVDRFPEVSSTSPTDGAVNVAATTDIVVNFTEAVNVTTSSFELMCPSSGSALPYAISGSGTAAITLNPDANLVPGVACEVTVKGNEVEDVDTNDGPNFMPGQFQFDFEVGIDAVDDVFAPLVLGNVEIDSDTISVLDNDEVGPSTKITFFGSGVNSGKTQQGGDVVVDSTTGTFTYDPPAGFEGSDSFIYTVTAGSQTSTATVSLTVAGMVWFIDAAVASECTTHCGRQSSPFKALGTFNTANQAGGASNPADNEPVLLFEGAYTGPVTLRTGQELIGEDATGALATLAGITIPAGSSIPFTNTGAAVTIAGADGINLAQNNAVYGLTLNTTGGQAIFGSTFGTLTLAASPDVTIASSGQALALSNGNLVGGFASVGSTGGTNNVSLTDVTTSLGAVSLGSGVLSGASNDAFVISNQNGSFTYAGTITNTAARAVNINSKTGGAVTFSGAINPGVVGIAGGVSLTTNPNTTITLSGGMTVSTATTVPFTATGGGTVEVTGTNILAVSGAAANAVNLNGITVGAGGISFSTVSSTGSTTGSAFLATSLTGGSLAVGSLTVAGTTGGTSHGIALTSNTSAVTISGGSVAGTAGDALFVSGGSAGVTVNANLTKTSAGRIANIASHTSGAVAVGGSLNCNTACTGILANANGGTIDFSHGTKNLSTATNAAVTLTGNSGTIGFTGGGLVINTTSGVGFSASGGGTVNVEGTTNSVTSTSGTAVSINGTTIGANGVRFVSVSANGGPNGIFLSNTGASGGLFRVDGTGSAGSGGSIVNTTGADGSTQGAGIYLNNTRSISIAFMALSGHANWAIRGNSVVGFTMNKTRITGTNGTSTATDDGSIYFTELTGSASITGSFIDGGFEDGVLVDNTTGTLDRITFDGDTIGSSSEISGDGMRLEASGGTLNATIQNTRFARAAGDMFQHNIIGNAQSDLDFLNNTMINGHPAISGGGGGVTITAAESGDLTYEINGNTIRGAKGVALVVNKPFGGAPGNGTMSGFIRNNVIGTPGATQNGSLEGSGMLIGLLAQGSHTTRIEDNQIYDYEEMGIFFNIGGTSQSVTGLTHNGTINATVVGNIIAEPLNLPGALAQNGIHLNAGTNSDGGNDAYQVCMDVGSGTAADRNTLNGAGAAGGQDIRLRQRFATTVRLPGYGGANNDNAAVQTYVLNRNNNSGSTTASAANTVATGGGGFLNTSPAGSACPQP